MDPKTPTDHECHMQVPMGQGIGQVQVSNIDTLVKLIQLCRLAYVWVHAKTSALLNNLKHI